MNKLLKGSSHISLVYKRMHFMKSMTMYQKEHELSLTKPEEFWGAQVSNIDWFKKPKIILDQSNLPFVRWFPDGELNLSYNCLDRHLSELKDEVALFHESPVTNSEAKWTYQELYEKVSRFAGGLQDTLKVKKGDRVIIYMPMVPEAVVAMLACTRIGAIHSVVFGGFAAAEVASRIKDSGSKVIITCNFGVEVKKKIEYLPIIKEAVEMCRNSEIKVVMFNRNKSAASMDYDFYNLLENSKPAECVPVSSTHPAYIIYTSGTTGTPKGVVRDTGGVAMSMSYSMNKIFNVGKRETMFAGSDIGWVVGHSYCVYGPLISGARSVIFEGKPVGTPDAGTYWRIVEKTKVKHLFTAPTAVRAMRRDDREGDFIKQCDLSSLKAMSLAGERCDIPTYTWLQEHLPKTLINDNYWQTETGWPMCSNYANLTTFDMKPGSACKPVPGYDIRVMEENGEEIKNDKLGKIVLKLPTPPAFAATLWSNDNAFKEKYFSTLPGYYISGDVGYRDSDGYFHMLEILFLSQDWLEMTMSLIQQGIDSQLHSYIMHDENVAEAVVIGVYDEIKGEVPIGFVTVKDTVKVQFKEQVDFLEKRVVDRIRKEFGPVASFKSCIIVQKLPKTRSGKYLRNIMRKMANHEEYKVPPTIEDPTILVALDKQIKSHGFGKHVDLNYEKH